MASHADLNPLIVLRAAAAKGRASLRAALTSLKANLPTAKYGAVFEDLRKVTGPRFGRSVGSFRPLGGDIFVGIPLPTMEFERELMWATACISSQAKVINDFVKARDEIESAFHRSGAGKAMEILSATEKKIGGSIWIHEAKMALAYVLGNVDDVTENIARIVVSNPKDLGTLILQCLLERTDEAASASGYRQRQLSRIRSWHVSENTSKYLEYRLAGIGAEGREKDYWAAILTFDSHGALCDLYQAVLECLECFAMQSSETSASATRALKQLSLLEDPRIRKLRALHDEDYFDSWHSAKLRAASANATDADADADAQHITWLGLWKFEEVMGHAAGVGGDSAASQRTNSMLKSEPLQIAKRDMLTLAERGPDALGAAQRLEKIAINLRPFAKQRSMETVTRILKSDNPYSMFRELGFGSRSPELAPLDIISAAAGVEEKIANVLITQASTVRDNSAQFALGFITGRTEKKEFEKFQSSYYFDLGKVYGHIFSDRWDRARSVALGIIDCLDEFVKSEVAKCLLWIRSEKEEFAEGVQEIAVSYVKSAQATEFLPVGFLFSNRPWSKFRVGEAGPHLAVALHCYTQRYRDEDQENNLRFAVKRLYEVVCDRDFSTMNFIAGEARDIWLFFLREVCVPANLQFISAFQTIDDVLNARMRVCQSLLEQDPKNKYRYESEIKQITYDLLLKEAVRQFDQTRVFVNKAAIATWATRELKENFNYYKNLSNAAPDARLKIQEALSKYAEGKHTLPEEREETILLLSSIPDTKADKLLVDLLKEIYTKYYLDPNDGLNHYLSQRVRHGSLSGYLRSPLEENNLIAKKVGNTEEYGSVEHWRYLQHLAPDSWQIVDDSIREFSQGYDMAVDDVSRELIQIRSAAKPRGLIIPSFTSAEYQIVKATISMETTFQEFLDSVFDFANSSLNAQLAIIRQQFGTTIKTSLIGLLESLKKNVSDVPTHVQLSTNIDGKINSAATQLRNSLDAVANWFRLEQFTDYERSYSADEVTDVAIQVVSNTHRNFSPSISKKINFDMPAFSGQSIAHITDTLFTILDNVYRRSGVPSENRVEIQLEHVSSGCLRIRVENDISPNLQAATNLERIRLLRESILSQAPKGLSSKASSEGGTGLSKLRLKSFGLDERLGKPALDFGITPSSRFFTEIHLLAVPV